MSPRFAVSVFLVVVLHSSLSFAASSERRVALVIGNSAYERAAPLRNPRNDADAIAAALAKLGFEVVKGTDLTYRDLRRTARDFAHKLGGADVALLFYAGHGLQVHGRNYLAPVDANLGTEVDLDFETVPLDLILSQMERGARTNLVFLDACRDNPLARNLARSMGTRSASIGRGLARVDAGVGTLIAFATQPGNVAQDGKTGNSPFTAAMLRHMDAPGLDISVLMRRVRQEVISETDGRQVPWDNSSLTAPFSFNPGATTDAMAAPSAPPQDDRSLDLALWQAAKDANSVASYEAYLAEFPGGTFAAMARLGLQALARAGEAKTSARAEDKVAALPSPTGEAQEQAPEGGGDPRALALALQSELGRVGCDAGTPDGLWGGRSRAALTEFNTHAKHELRIDRPTPEALEAVKRKRARVCPEQARSADRAVAAAPNTSPCGRIPGVWSWFIGGDVTFKPGGAAVQGGLTATWTCSNGRVVMVWSHGFTDRLALSADGTHMSGTNNWGFGVSGTRKGGN